MTCRGCDVAAAPTRLAALIDWSGSRGDDEVMIKEETPGGTVGCDVCGILLAADKVEAHRAWHRTEVERFDRLTRQVQELVDQLRGTRA